MIDIGIFLESELYQCVVLDLAQDDPDGRVFVIEFDLEPIGDRRFRLARS
ncbi:hypothetical protein ACK11Z_10055 [Methanoculleus bourgensis]